MYKIGEFSKITSLTGKALRYYDEAGILVPGKRDSNGYRMYDDADYEKARMIALLRDLDFSIAEIKDIMENCEGPEDLQYCLTEKQEAIAKRIRKEKALIARMEQFKSPEKASMEVCKMKYTCEVEEMKAMNVVSKRYQGKYGEVGEYFGQLYKQVKGKAAGAPFNLYYDEEYKENADIEACVPVKGPMSGSKVIQGKRMLCTIHVGSYETLGMAYKAIIDYAKQKGITLTTPSMEVYEKGPGMIFKGNPEKYVTKIMIPVEE